MARDRHVGRAAGAFTIRAKPESFIKLINTHGVFSRVVRSRKCPCITETGSPSLVCKNCHGDGFINDFQRELLQSDEITDVNYSDTTILEPYRVPMIRPLKAETVLPPEQGGIIKHEIVSFNENQIIIAAENKPRYYHPVRVSYIFDRYEYVEAESPLVNPDHRILKVQGPIIDDGNSTSNIQEAAGDITIIKKIWDVETGEEFKIYKFHRNYIFVENATLRPGKVRVSYYYAPIERVLVTDLANNQMDSEDFQRALLSGAVRVTLAPWFEIGQGDIITLLTATYYRDEVIAASDAGVDELTEWEVSDLDTTAFDSIGNIYVRDTDFILLPRNKVKWIKKRPNVGHSYTIRYGYRPTLIVYQDGPQPNVLENRTFPKVVFMQAYSRTRHKELARFEAPAENNEEPGRFFYSE